MRSDRDDAARPESSMAMLAMKASSAVPSKGAAKAAPTKSKLQARARMVAIDDVPAMGAAKAAPTKLKSRARGAVHTASALPSTGAAEAVPTKSQSRADGLVATRRSVPSTGAAKAVPTKSQSRARAGVPPITPMPPKEKTSARTRSAAKLSVSTTDDMPPTDAVEVFSDTTNLQAKPNVDDVSGVPAKGGTSVPPAKSNSKALTHLQTPVRMPSNGEDPVPLNPAAEVRLATMIRLPLPLREPVPPAIIDALISYQRQRQFCIISQSRIDRSCESLLARVLGFTAEMEATQRKAVYAKAAAFRRAIEKGEPGASPELAPYSPLIQQSAASRAAWDILRRNTEKEMQAIARRLPAWTWASGVLGLSAVGLASIIGETGDLANYATKERVWKRLGLAVIDGISQQRRSGAEQAALHGFNPKRRAVVWNIGDVMLRAQWRGARDDAPAHPIGPYGAVYGRRKAHTVNREGWTPKHRDNDARRVMTKALIEDLWRVWHGMVPLALSTVMHDS
nr:hypothetical protein [uncultured Roseococcus sp.]